MLPRLRKDINYDTFNQLQVDWDSLMLNTVERLKTKAREARLRIKAADKKKL